MSIKRPSAEGKDLRLLGIFLRVLKLEAEGENYYIAHSGNGDNVCVKGSSLLTIFSFSSLRTLSCNLCDCCRTDLKCLFQSFHQLHWIKIMITELL